MANTHYCYGAYLQRKRFQRCRAKRLYAHYWQTFTFQLCVFYSKEVRDREGEPASKKNRQGPFCFVIVGPASTPLPGLLGITVRAKKHDFCALKNFFRVLPLFSNILASQISKSKSLSSILKTTAFRSTSPYMVPF